MSMDQISGFMLQTQTLQMCDNSIKVHAYVALVRMVQEYLIPANTPGFLEMLGNIQHVL